MKAEDVDLFWFWFCFVFFVSLLYSDANWMKTVTGCWACIRSMYYVLYLFVTYEVGFGGGLVMTR